VSRIHGEDGHAAVTLVIVAPLLIVLLLFIVGLGRFATARGQVDSAAREAARSASLERAPGVAQTAGKRAAATLLGGEKVTCSTLTVSVDTSEFRPGGAVSATVTCVASLAGLGMSGLPGTRTFRATSVAPIEVHRSR
jgi:Flp pilus assembly protein TadG